MLKACCRLWVALERVSLWKSIRSGLRNKHTQNESTADNKAKDTIASFHLQKATSCLNKTWPSGDEVIAYFRHVLHLYLCLWIRALKARPSLQHVVKFWMFTSEYLTKQSKL